MHIMLPEDVLGCIRDYIYVPPHLRPPPPPRPVRVVHRPTFVVEESDVEFTSEEEEVDDDYSYGLGYQSDDY